MSDEHRKRRKLYLICLLALFIGLIGIVLPEQEDIAFEYVVNNTDLYNNGRITGVNYTANDSAIQLFLIFHVVGTGASLAVDTNLSINGTVVEDRDYRTTAGAGIHEHFSIMAHIPRGAVYNVTNGTELETLEWREYPILSGRNGTLSINMTGGGTGSQNLSQVLDQGNTADNRSINFTNSGKWFSIGYNPSQNLMELTTSQIFYFKQAPSTYIGYMGSGYAYSAYDNRPMKLGQSAENASTIMYNTTHGTRWQGLSKGGANNNLNITGFDKVNMYQELDLNNNSIVNVNYLNTTGLINTTLLNKSYNSFRMLGSTTSDPFYTSYENSTMRIEMTLGGTQIWRLRNTDSTKAEVGYITYATPGGNPGIAMFNTSLGYRSTFANENPGTLISSSSSGSPNVNGLHVGFDNNITVDGLAGTGNAYACLDANGKLYRGNPTC